MMSSSRIDVLTLSSMLLRSLSFIETYLLCHHLSDKRPRPSSLLWFLRYSFPPSFFSLSAKILIFNIFLHPHVFDGVRFQYSQLLVSFLYSERSDFCWFGLRTDEEKKQKVPRNNNYRRRLRRWHSDTGKYTRPSRNTTA